MRSAILLVTSRLDSVRSTNLGMGKLRAPDWLDQLKSKDANGG